MGSEQSTAAGRRGRGASLDSPLSPTSGGQHPFDPLAALSRDEAARGRHDSVASDVESSSEVPYVSYTVNRPIGGDSPKKKAPGTSGAASRLSKFSSSRTDSPRVPSARDTMVVVATGDTAATAAADPELVRLRELPSFLPIMRASLSGSGAKDPDILERLDFRGLLSMTERYEGYLRKNASVTSTQQAELTRLVRDVDRRAAAVTQGLAERQKHYAKSTERLSRIGEVSRILSKCHLLLNENIEQMEILNNMLPPDDRLEPFVWTTG